jgi:hypothetical protein
VVHRLDDRLVGEDVELLLHLPLNVLVVGRAENVDEAGAANLARDHLRREREVVQDSRQLPGGLRVLPLLLDDEALDRDDRGRGVMDHG